MSKRVISQEEFKFQLQKQLTKYSGKVRSVYGPGRSGAVASVYASHFLKIPWITSETPLVDNLRPVLIVDTAICTGRTIRKAARNCETDFWVALFDEPPIVKFWYEDFREVE